VRTDRLEEYVARHAEVWPEMLDALSAAGLRNYSLVLDDTGDLIGYFECDDFGAAVAAMQETDVNARWQAEMAEFFEDLGGGAPDTSIVPLRQVFFLA
jgi:L-rhamnose mutarotase